jgi:hypothetical protein
MKIVSNFLARKSMGGNVEMPFANSGHFIIEEIGESDSTRSADIFRDENLVGGARVMAGGGCSPR